MPESFVVDQIQTPAGAVPVVRTTLDIRDHLGGWGVRWAYNRADYRVRPGLFAVGCPDAESPVLVSANYKLSFDVLRKELNGFPVWILVLDTKGINVWCAAGKGSFGTSELVKRIGITGLEKVVSHRRLILPQLGAVGVSAHEIRKETGFNVKYGPIRASDLPAYLSAGMEATPDMREVEFGFYDRLVLTPVEIVGGLKHWLVITAVMLLLSGLHSGGYSSDLALSGGFRAGVMIFLALVCGGFFGPVLLPFIPGRAFAWKGFVLGTIGIIFAARTYLLPSRFSTLEVAAWILAVPALSSFVTMNFTGASTYTSLSGVLKEMKIAIPIQIGAAVIAAVLWLVSRFVK